MNNRMALALAVGGGYVLGRTRKAKLALGLGGLVLGRRLTLGPQGLARLVGERLLGSPQLQEAGDRFRQDLRGVGRAAADAVVTRQLDGLADRLHDRTLDVHDRLSARIGQDGAAAADDRGDGEEADDGDRRTSAKRTSGKRTTAGRPPAKRASGREPGKASAGKPAKKAADSKTTARKTASAARGATRKTTRAGGGGKGGGDRA